MFYRSRVSLCGGGGLWAAVSASLPCLGLRMAPMPCGPCWLTSYPPEWSSSGGAVSSWGRDLPPFLWHLEWDTVDRRHEACQQIRIRTLRSSSSVPPGGKTQGQSRKRTCPRSHSKSGKTGEWNPNPTNPQSMALCPQSTANEQLTGTKEGNEGQAREWWAGQAQNKAGV